MSIDWNAIADAGGLSKGPSRARTKRADHKTEVDVIIETRKAVFERDVACRCGGCRPSHTDEMNEIISRAKTRGLAPEVRFNTRNCIRLSRACHKDVTEHRKALEVLSEDGANDTVHVWQMANVGICFECRQQRQLFHHSSELYARCRLCVEGPNVTLLHINGRRRRHVSRETGGDMDSVTKPVKQPKRPQPQSSGNPPVTKARVKVHLNRPEERAVVLRALQRDDAVIQPEEQKWVKLLLRRLQKGMTDGE